MLYLLANLFKLLEFVASSFLCLLKQFTVERFFALAYGIAFLLAAHDSSAFAGGGVFTSNANAAVEKATMNINIYFICIMLLK